MTTISDADRARIRREAFEQAAEIAERDKANWADVAARSGLVSEAMTDCIGHLYDAVASAIRALAEKEAGDGWRSVENDPPPKDGTLFWGLVGRDAIAMFWHAGFSAFVSRFNRMTLAQGMTWADTGLPYQGHSPAEHTPRFWRTLPAPPRAEKEGGRDADS